MTTTSLKRWIFLLITLTAVTCNDLLEHTGTRLTSNDLQIEEVTQIMRDSDRSGQNHSLRVTVAEHSPLNNVTEWLFTLHTHENEFINYRINGDGENPTLQTEFVFNGNLEECDSFILRAMDGPVAVAMSYMVMDLHGLESDASWVGEPRTNDISSLRIVADDRTGDIRVHDDEEVCSPSKSPCYYIEPEWKPKAVKRCTNVTKAELAVRLCDERVSEYEGLGFKPRFMINEEKNFLGIEFTFERKMLEVEAVAYDISDPTKIFSSYPYRCRFPVGKMWEEGEKMLCRQELSSVPEELTEMKVIVVVRDEEGRVQSTLEFFDTTADRKLSIEKFSKVTKEDDPTGENHNTKVTTSHHPLANVVEWKLILHKNNREEIIYTAEANDDAHSTSSEIIFEGNLESSESVVLQARNNTGKVAQDYLVVDIQDLEDSVAWVGGDRESSSSSLRIMPGDIVTEVTAGDYTCSKDEGPCYFITPKNKPQSVERCKESFVSSKRSVQICDERVTGFQKISPTPGLSLSEDGKLEVELNLEEDEETFTTEVVTFDHHDHSKIFSTTTSGYRCYIPVGVESEDGKMKCFHDFNLPEGMTEFMVLVVKINMKKTVIASSLLHFDANDKSRAAENTGVIVGSVVGVLLGLALIAVIVKVILGKRKSAKSAGSPEVRYQAASTKEDKTETENQRSMEEGKE